MSSILLRQFPRSTRAVTRIPRRWTSSISQRPGSDRVQFPGAVNSKFTTDMAFINPSQLPSIPTYRILDSNGVLVDKDRGPPDVPKEEIVTWYKNMLTALTDDDVVFAQYRETGVYQQRGFTLHDFMSQLFANCHDNGRGRNMPCHYGSKFPRTNPDLPSRIVACYFGEGAASEGDFHAGLNIAATRSSPVVFLCRNNGYAISTPTLEQYRGDGIASRGVGYGIDTIRVDGNDIFAVYEAMREARRVALSDGGKPVLVEAMSYRVSHHSTSDDSFAYRARVEVEDWKRRDNPIIRLRKWLENEGLWNEDLERDTREGLRKAVLKEFKDAERELKPAIGEAFTGVYEELTEEQQQQKKELRRILETYPDEYDLRQHQDGINGL
ncbi:hypothetical protein FE257_006143 [Aspergillus nanangensis]|uniref:2-oxoisovalerate dehydrogenase subunit alpha n=1 Tax=Aspergillus nanangensis TaxID=2582783 RepID=A0AAD4GUZ3_ASPNN|nr:hypothetical protein FE257_006143 [Aspergillus nanangensis]